LGDLPGKNLEGTMGARGNDVIFIMLFKRGGAGKLEKVTFFTFPKATTREK
jgi:hypothetical protein